MSVQTELNSENLYEIARVGLRNKKKSEKDIRASLLEAGANENEAEHILNTAILIHSDTYIKTLRGMLISKLGSFIFLAIFFFVVSHSVDKEADAGFLNYLILAGSIVVPLVISYAVNHGIISTETRKQRIRLYTISAAYIFCLVVYLAIYNLTVGNDMYELLFFLFIIVDFNIIFRMNYKPSKAVKSPKLKAMQSEERQSKIFKRIWSSSSLIIIYALIASAPSAIASFSFIPFGIAVICTYWAVVNFIRHLRYFKGHWLPVIDLVNIYAIVWYYIVEAKKKKVWDRFTRLRKLVLV